MKKIFLISLIFFLLTGFNNLTFAQVKANVFLSNPGISNPGGYWKMDIRVTVPAGQTWRVGSSNIRVDWVTFPANKVSVKLDNPAINPNANLHNNANYAPMTTTSILGGTAASLNIARLNACYVMPPGTYKLGEIRFNRLDTTACIRLAIRTNSVLQDSITQMMYPANWTYTVDTTCYRLDYLVGNSSSADNLPKEFKLYDNYPNPFNPATTIKYDLPKQSFVKIAVYDVKGEEVETLVNQVKDAGAYEIKWDGSKYSSGVYIYKFESGQHVFVKKMILVK